MRYSEDAKAKKKASDELALLTPIVKAFLTETGFEVCNDGLQVYGGVLLCVCILSFFECQDMDTSMSGDWSRSFEMPVFPPCTREQQVRS